MKRILVGHDDLVGPWVSYRYGGKWHSGQGATIGLEDARFGLIAGVVYTDFNGANVNMHLAAHGSSWLTREFLWICFDYPFNQLGCRRVTGIVPASNERAMKFDKHLGFELEATLKDAAPDGDVHLLCMRRDQCRWLSLRSRVHGKTLTPAYPRLHTGRAGDR